jgi:hypothetical protein
MDAQNVETDPQPLEAAPVPPPGPPIERIGQLIEDWKATIYIQELVDGEERVLSLADLDEILPMRGAYWRGVLTERYRLGGSLPIRAPAGFSDTPGDK